MLRRTTRTMHCIIPNNPYIMVCDRPKIEALKQQFPELFKDYKGK